MLIRSRLLLLALLPVPVIVVLALITFNAERSAAHQATLAAESTALAGLGHDVAEALQNERDAVAQLASLEARGLEALILEGGLDDDAPAKAGLDRRAAATDLALTRLVEAAQAVGGVAETSAQSIAEAIAELRPVRNAGSTLDAIERYEPMASLLRSFGDNLTSGIDDADGLRTLRVLAISSRLQDHFAIERICVRHALITSDIPPDLARLLVANEAQLARQKELLLNTFGDPESRSALADLIESSRRRGRDALVQSLIRFTARQDILSLLQETIGFGGLIHNFKNFAIRGDRQYRDEARAQSIAAIGLLDQLEQVGGLSPAELEDSAKVRAALATFAGHLETIADMRGRGASSAEIDAAVRVDDRPSSEALSRLSLFRGGLQTSEWEQLSRQVDRRLGTIYTAQADRFDRRARAARDASVLRYQWLAAALAITIGLLALVTFLTFRRLSTGMRVLVGEFNRVATTGDVEVRIQVDGSDELSQINEAVAAIGKRMQVLAGSAERMSLGDYSRQVEPLSEKDRLAMSLQMLRASAAEVVHQAQAISAGRYETVVTPRSAQDSLATALADMAQSLRVFRDDTERTQWLNERRLRVFESLRDPCTPADLGKRILDALLPVTGCPLGIFHTFEADGFHAIAWRGVAQTSNTAAGFVDRALQLKSTQHIAPLPAGYLPLSSGLGEADLPGITLTPVRASSEVVGAIELGWLQAPDALSIELLDSLAESIAIAMSAAEARARTELLLEETQAQTHKLEHQQVELRQINEELESQTQALRQSEVELKSQREELQTTNEELEEKSEVLERQQKQLRATAEELQKATHYKSEFLANMSHELRTPLNSLLILSRDLAENSDGNLNEEQIQSARIIHEGGRDLLGLINDILDLSKVEAGRLDIHGEPVSVKEMLGDLERQFAPMAREKKVTFRHEQRPEAPGELFTDRTRLGQILRNLVSNAIKFTSEGEVTLTARLPGRDIVLSGMKPEDAAIQLDVQDTGIGIAADRLDHVFEAFRQADGSTSRRYGGTGLGLTIARQLAGLLGGEIHARSEVGKGSCFSVILPQTMPSKAQSEPAKPLIPPATPLKEPEAAPEIRARSSRSMPGLEDDREGLKTGERSILIIEDDQNFAGLMRDLVRRQGFKVVLAGEGHDGLALARELQPSAIVLDLGLPDLDGLEVLDRIKAAVETRHIPVHVISAKAPSTEVLARGAAGYVHKPAESEELHGVLSRIESLISQSQRTVLVVEDDVGSQHAIRKLLQNERTRVLTASSGADAMAVLETESADCIVLDLTLPDTDGIAFLEKLRAQRDHLHMPVVVYTGRELDREENQRLSELAQSIVIKGAASPERLLDEVVLFLHTIQENLNEDQRKIVSRLHSGTEAFTGRKLLLVDDDMRNSFALAGVLRKQGFKVILADNGELALKRLGEQPDIDLVVMDVMMPVMDGLEATRRIREQERFKHLPVIAVTARAMTEDRRRCLDAGASDYLSKPIDMDQLLAMLRIWLGRTA